MGQLPTPALMMGGARPAATQRGGRGGRGSPSQTTLGSVTLQPGIKWTIFAFVWYALKIFFHILAGQWRTVVEAWEARWQVWASWRAAQGRGERVRGDPCCHEWGREGEREALVRKWRWTFFEGSSSPPTLRNWLLRSGLILSWFVWIWTFGLPWSGKCD